jgi:hypothetical protein
MKKFLVAAVAVCSMVLAMTSPVFANSVVGTYTIADNGQGGWSGGPLLSDGTLGGGGGVSFLNGLEVGKIVSGTWRADLSVTPPIVDICLTTQPIKDPLNMLSGTMCFPPIPADGLPHKVASPMGGTTIFRVSLH